MNNFNKVKEEAKSFVKKNKDFFDRFSQEIDNLTIGNYLDLYVGSKGIIGLYAGDKFDADYYNALDNFCKQKNMLDDVEQIIISYLDFLIWLKKQQCMYKVKIAEQKRLHKHALEFPNLIKRIFLNKQLDEKDKFEILLFYYCSLQEIFKNVVQEELLLEIWKQGKTDSCDLRKKHIQLGDFISIIDKYASDSSEKNKMNTIFNVELRNKILHADYFIESDEIKYGGKSLSNADLHNQIVKLGISLQFFVLFYLRLFNKTIDD